MALPPEILEFDRSKPVGQEYTINLPQSATILSKEVGRISYLLHDPTSIIIDVISNWSGESDACSFLICMSTSNGKMYAMIYKSRNYEDEKTISDLNEMQLKIWKDMLYDLGT